MEQYEIDRLAKKAKRLEQEAYKNKGTDAGKEATSQMRRLDKKLIQEGQPRKRY
jgi:hypothetical protein